MPGVSGYAFFVGWLLTCTALVVLGILTQSLVAWLMCLVAAVATGVTLLGLAQAPEQTIAEIIHDAQQG